MKCKYCGKETKQYKAKDWCATCDSKLPSAKRFVEECDRFKMRIGYYKIKQIEEVQTNETI